MYRLRLLLLVGAVALGLSQGRSAPADDKTPPPAPAVSPKSDPKAGDPAKTPTPTTPAADPAKTPTPVDAAKPPTPMTAPMVPATPAKPSPSVIPVNGPPPLDGIGGAAGPTATVFTKNADEAFDKYVDLAILGKAWATMDPVLMTDVGLQLAEGERVLLRPHKSVTAAKVLDEALKLAVEKKDMATLDRLAKAADRGGNKELGGKVAAARLLGTASRSVHPALSIALDDITPAGLIKFQAVRDALQAARLKSDRTTLGELEKELAADKVIPVKQREFLTKQLEDAKKAMPAAPDPQTELLNKLGAGSRGPLDELKKAGGAISGGYKKTTVGQAGINAQNNAQALRDRARIAAEAEARRISDQAKAVEAAARRKAGELAAQAKIERDKRAKQLAANEAAARKKAGELAQQAKIERDKRLAQAATAAAAVDKARIDAHRAAQQIPATILKNTLGNGPKPDVSRFTDPDYPSTPTNKPPGNKPSGGKKPEPGIIIDGPTQTKTLPTNRPPATPTPTWPTKPSFPMQPTTPTQPTTPEPLEETEPVVEPTNPPTVEPTEPEPDDEMFTWYTRELVIHNDTEETLQVYVRYYAPDDEDDFSWFPGDEDEKEQWAGPFIVKPGAKSLLKDGDDVIFGNKVQIKATSKNSDTEWGVFKVDLVGEDGYESKEMTKYTFRLFP